MRVAFLSSDPDSASARVRIRSHLPGLAALGIEAELLGLPRGLRARRRVVAGLRDRDLVVLHRRLLDPLSLRALRGSARALALDLDDAIWERPFRARALRNRLRWVRLLRQVDLVTVGSAWLAEQVGRRHDRVRLIRPAPPPRVAAAASALDPADAADAAARKRLVWTGSRATLPYLEALGPVLATLGERVPGLVVDVVADAEPTLPGVTVAFHRWSLEAEARAIAGAQVGLYPLLDDPWSRGKCAYKALLYMQFGLPTVASPQGGGAEVLEPPRAGLVARQPAEWLAALEGLLTDEPRRLALGRQARALSQARDDHAAHTQAWADALRAATSVGS